MIAWIRLGWPKEDGVDLREESRRETPHEVEAVPGEPELAREFMGAIRGRVTAASRSKDLRKDSAWANLHPVVIGLIVLVLLGSSAYARARYVCQNLKDDGQFFSGMDVERCTSRAIRTPALSLRDQLAVINARY